MKNKVHVVIFYCYHIILLAGALFVNREDLNAYRVIDSYLKNVFVFSSLLFLETILMIEDKSFSLTVRRILKYTVIFIVGLFIIAIGSLGIVHQLENIQNICYLMIHIFCILCIILFINLLLTFKNGKIIQQKLFYLLLIECIFYCFCYYYGNNIIILNCFRFYFSNNFNIGVGLYYSSVLLFLSFLLYNKSKKDL